MSYDNDPFSGGDKTPAVSFKGKPVGTTVVMQVTEPATLQQSSVYNPNPDAPRVLATWPDGNPKMAAVVVGTVDGERRSFWAGKPSSLFAAIRDAQAAAGAKIAPGGTLTVTFYAEKPTNGDPQKLYRATYQPPSAGDAFADRAPAAPAQQAVSAPAAPPAAPAPSVDVAALKSRLSGLRVAGLTDAQIAASAPQMGIVGPNGAPLTADAVAAILAT